MLLTIIISTQCKQEKKNVIGEKIDCRMKDALVNSDSNKKEKKIIQSDIYYGIDTTISFAADKYRIITKREEHYKLHYAIYKNGVYQYNDSIDICGYYEISMNDFNGDGFPDIQLDLRCGNNHTESYVFIWNNTFNRFVNKINETHISLIKPNYFVSFNNNNVSEYQYDFYKILDKFPHHLDLSH